MFFVATCLGGGNKILVIYILRTCVRIKQNQQDADFEVVSVWEY